jgi:uncharacterized membrane protein YczE
MMKRRLFQLYAGLILFGISAAMMVRSGLGLKPWDVLHEGLSKGTGLSFGNVVIVCGLVVLLLWIPLRQKPGIGTVSNVLVIGLVADGALQLIPAPEGLARHLLLVAGIGLNGVATAAYIGAGLGPGPRDGLMTGVAQKMSWPISHVRTGIEVAVLAMGWFLGGTVGAGTLLYALTIGAIVHRMLPLLTLSTTGASAWNGCSVNSDGER